MLDISQPRLKKSWCLLVFASIERHNKQNSVPPLITYDEVRINIYETEIASLSIKNIRKWPKFFKLVYLLIWLACTRFLVSFVWFVRLFALLLGSFLLEEVKSKVANISLNDSIFVSRIVKFISCFIQELESISLFIAQLVLDRRTQIVEILVVHCHVGSHAHGWVENK